MYLNKAVRSQGKEMWEEEHGCSQQRGRAMALWLVLFLIMFLIYFTQIIKMVRLKTSKGLSYQYLVLRTLGQLYALCNIIVYKASSIHCCAGEQFRDVLCILPTGKEEDWDVLDQRVAK
ncbi:hypothetical protein DSO57_1008349 [Entomophthora muscae]|uniref:Uncharacterized protein n=1 Tax=Entomophthora muscae TaxID=34485 RepID=A0ACC2S911_9FUNG|nr:hypothetical protein DSO57_1008349 [Entomophthora muscae]